MKKISKIKFMLFYSKFSIGVLSSYGVTKILQVGAVGCKISRNSQVIAIIFFVSCCCLLNPKQRNQRTNVHFCAELGWCSL